MPASKRKLNSVWTNARASRPRNVASFRNMFANANACAAAPLLARCMIKRSKLCANKPRPVQLRQPRLPLLRQQPLQLRPHVRRPQFSRNPRRRPPLQPLGLLSHKLRHNLSRIALSKSSANNNLPRLPALLFAKVNSPRARSLRLRAAPPLRRTRRLSKFSASKPAKVRPPAPRLQLFRQPRLSAVPPPAPRRNQRLARTILNLRPNFNVASTR